MNSVTLPWPAKPLWPNFRSRSHWPKTRATKKARGEAAMLTKAARIGIAAGDVPITIRATFYPPDAHARDGDNCNASLKAYLDGIADALKVNDSFFRLQPPAFGEPVKGGAVVVTVGDCDARSFGELAADIVSRLAPSIKDQAA